VLVVPPPQPIRHISKIEIATVLFLDRRLAFAPTGSSITSTGRPHGRSAAPRSECPPEFPAKKDAVVILTKLPGSEKPCKRLRVGLLRT
jgi:hypothetical protein